MKKTSKALLLGLCALLLVGASVLGTMAYLTAKTEKVVNTFTVGNVGITLDEGVIDSTTGKFTDNGKSRTASGQEYHLLPGSDYDKDPTVTVTTGSESCYLFVKVENGIKEIEDTAHTVASQMEAKNWKLVRGTTDVYVLYNEDGSSRYIANAEDKKVVFDKFYIAGTVDGDTLAKYSERKADGTPKYTITVSAYAIQASGLNAKTDAELWALVPATN